MIEVEIKCFVRSFIERSNMNETSQGKIIKEDFIPRIRVADEFVYIEIFSCRLIRVAYLK